MYREESYGSIKAELTHLLRRLEKINAEERSHENVRIGYYKYTVYCHRCRLSFILTGVPLNS